MEIDTSSKVPIIKVNEGSKVSSVMNLFQNTMNATVESLMENGTTKSAALKCMLNSFNRFQVLEREVSKCQTMFPIQVKGNIIQVMKITKDSKMVYSFEPTWNYPSSEMKVSTEVMYGKG